MASWQLLLTSADNDCDLRSFISCIVILPTVLSLEMGCIVNSNFTTI